MTEQIEEIQEDLNPPAPTPEEIEARQQAEEQARKYGWRPKEEFDLEPEGWVDADRFLEFPQTQNKMLRDEMKELRASVEAKDQEIQKVQQGAIEATRKIDGLVQDGVQRELDRLREEKRAAVEAADTEQYQILEEREQKVIAAQGGNKPQADPAVLAYKADPKNTWAQNPVLWNQAAQIVQSNPAVLSQPAVEQVKYAEEQIRMMYPAYFKEEGASAAPQRTTPKVDAGGMGGVFKTGTSAADLPPEALKAGKDFVSEGVFKSMEDYAKAYFSEGN